jgi:Trypsin/PA14 domain
LKRFLRSTHLLYAMATAFSVLCPPAIVHAIVIAGGTPPDFEQALVSPIEGETFPGVGWYTTGEGGIRRFCSGVLISRQHVLTAAHCFFSNRTDGSGELVPTPKEFVLSDLGKSFPVARYHVHPDYNSKEGHRVRVGGPAREAFDLAIITLKAEIPGAKSYPVNKGQGQIPDEREPALTTVKVGFGLWKGNGTKDVVVGVVIDEATTARRFMLNRVDQFGDGKTTWHTVGERNNPPPINTLVYAFNNPKDGPNGSTKLRNFHDAKLGGAVPPVMIKGMPVQYEGSPVGGDSGGPMFQRKDAKSPWVVVGITSSTSDPDARFGSVAYDTRLFTPKNLDFIRTIVPTAVGRLSTPVNVAIFSECQGLPCSSTTVGSGAPYSGLVGTFQSLDIQFASRTGFDWRPLGQVTFGADMAGVLHVATTDTYLFTLTSDDGGLLLIDGSVVVNNGWPHPPMTTSESVTLLAGTHSFEVQFFECCGPPSGVDLDLPSGVTFGFAGTPGQANCHGESVAELNQQFGSLPAAVSALGFPSVETLQGAIRAFCVE